MNTRKYKQEIESTRKKALEDTMLVDMNPETLDEDQLELLQYAQNKLKKQKLKKSFELVKSRRNETDQIFLHGKNKEIFINLMEEEVVEKGIDVEKDIEVESKLNDQSPSDSSPFITPQKNKSELRQEQSDGVPNNKSFVTWGNEQDGKIATEEGIEQLSIPMEKNRSWTNSTRVDKIDNNRKFEKKESKPNTASSEK